MNINYASGKYIINKMGRALFVLREPKLVQPDQYKLGYKLKEETILKFGKTKFTVKELSFPTSDWLLNILEPPAWGSKELAEAEVEYRICKDVESTRDNPLVSPCKCSGSVKYVHIKCIKAWYSTKAKQCISSRTCSFYIKGLRCEICREELPISFT
jgi:hypothetical protein